MGRATPAHGLWFRSVNGDITLTLPRGFRADADLSTGGDVRSDFPLLTRARRNRGPGRSRMEGDIGGGGPPLRVATLNGDIALRAAPE